MRIGVIRISSALLGLALVAGCGAADEGGGSGSGSGKKRDPKAAAAAARPLPGVGKAMYGRVPKESRQLVAVYGKGPDSASSTVVLYEKQGSKWRAEHRWAAHNGKRGWTPDHREGDKRSPVGVFTLSDAGGVLADPGAKLPYSRSGAFTAPRYWPKTHWHDFDLVLAIDYNRVKGRSPIDPTRPQGQKKGGGIWFHLDHGSGTSGCVSLSKDAMTTLLRTLDPKQHPVAVMGDRASLLES
ncbi:L,D-transpeptidase family protein [Streptomyces sp. A7024]|uniref:L,D-transpeptidase family protein n=1 Tax=Streptomyces coryli TaxID=1128680 RepID=A0A6G4U7D0_9ACTN|nr:L,D-transpeptidase family protein [Streptomyces coryli]NGN67101.1 L,D-transpeptidase family protein [Streptomyces coryli]